VSSAILHYFTKKLLPVNNGVNHVSLDKAKRPAFESCFIIDEHMLFITGHVLEIQLSLLHNALDI